MGEYYSYNTICNWMKRIAERIPEIAEVIDIGTTSEGRSILGLKITKFNSDNFNSSQKVISFIYLTSFLHQTTYHSSYPYGVKTIY
uniref:Peptidase_M14 domain-containing protein n=1 Tax=Heterorhabditis bacteriophora TaxID=37862 RepID=A0A1I7WS54_HETBA